MKKIIATLTISALALGAIGVTQTINVSAKAPTPSVVADSHDKQISKQIDELLQSKKFNGTVLVAKDGKVFMSKGFGESNFTTHTKNDSETIFRIGSVSKSVTAVAVMQLVEQGKLNLDDPINKFFPDFPSGDKITVHQLLSHTSGIGDEAFLEELGKEPAAYYSSAKMLEVGKRAAEKLNSDPGTKYSYSNIGYHLLGLIIEQVSHTTWDNYVNEHIIKPANMTRSGVDINEPIVRNHAVGGDPEGKPTPFMDMSYAEAAGGLYSTVGDLLKFDQALTSEKLLSKKSFEKMTTPVQESYGYGWVDGSKLKQSSDWKWHNGEISGYLGFNAINTKENMEVIVLTNKEIDTKEFALEIAGGVIDILDKMPSDPGKAKNND
ncbi:serine hydrolase domain-containing protein [Paenibacillus aestuarii]|uniref:Serine hydrolase domain-containing protein n=1 Tax=Paenibacillus aestuarii TaxID=516965 RepID=A0ABW0K953_9BACL|nr:serine hydrolase domain-containing protein [Paenibacillus aestuarii]